jgi:HSP20 family protein
MTQAVKMMEEDRFASMARQMTKWVDQVLGPTYHRFCPSETWSPSVNFYEDDETYCMVVDLAGVKVDEIDLKAESGLMVLRGQRSTPSMPDAKGRLRLHHMEIDHGPFCRTIELPSDVSVDAIPDAAYRNGFLYIQLPKKR